MNENPERVNIFFRLASLAGALFVVTVLAMFAAVFSPPASPLTRFVDSYALTAIVIEVMAVLIFGVLAMAADQRGGRNRHDGTAEANETSESNTAGENNDPASDQPS